LPRRRLQIHERWAGTAVLRRPSQLPRPTSAVAQARPSSPTWLPPRTAAAASFLVALRKKALKEQATARCPDILSLLTDETMGGSARSSSQSPPGTDAGAGHRGQPVGGDGPCGRLFFSSLFLPSFIPLSFPSIHTHRHSPVLFPLLLALPLLFSFFLQ